MATRRTGAATPDRTGLLLALSAHLLWGVFPLYFGLLRQAGAVEIIGHRIVWSFLFCLVGILVLRQGAQLRAALADRRLLGGLSLAGIFVATNWLLYVWGIINDHVVDAALGYFINPLVTVGLAVVVLKERLRRGQVVALGVGAVAVVVIVVGHGLFPWLALALAGSFAVYGLLKNRLGGHVAPLVGLTVETAALTPVALVYLVVLQVGGTSTFLGHGTVHTVALMCAGGVTAVPLLLFAGAARRIPLALMGMIQYVTPVIQFSIGVWVNHEVMPPARWAGFALVWVALVILSVDGLAASRHTPVIEPEIMD